MVAVSAAPAIVDEAEKEIRWSLALRLPPVAHSFSRPGLGGGKGARAAFSVKDATERIFAGSTALQLRGHLLSWAIVLDVLRRLGAASPKAQTIAQYLRERDLVRPVMEELSEHIIAASAAAEAVKLNTEGIARPMLCLPEYSSLSRQSPMPIRRLMALRKLKDTHGITDDEEDDDQNNDDDDVDIDHNEAADECIFYGPLCAYLFLRTLRQLPVLSRSWWLSSERAVSKAMEQVAGAHFSPLLVQEELSLVREAASSLQDESCTISTNTSSSSTADFMAQYTRSDISMGLTIRLPAAYPLARAVVEFKDRVKLEGGMSQKWAVSISSILSSQNGRIVDAMRVWKRSLDQYFEGVEDCTICFCLVHATTREVPRAKCRQCNNKFHSACLYKWFNTSGSSKCPLCRALF